MFYLILFLTGIISIFLLMKMFRQEHLSAMPGPTSWTVVGNLLQMDRQRPYITTRKWAQTYGDVYKITIFGKDIVLLSGTDILNEALVTKGKDFANKPITFRMKEWSANFSDIHCLPMYGPEYDHMRSLLCKGLQVQNCRDIEDKTTRIINHFVEELNCYANASFDPLVPISNCIIKILYLMIFNKEIDNDDPELEIIRELKKATASTLAPLGNGTFLDMFPFLRFFKNETYRKLEYFKVTSKQLFNLWKEDVDRKEIGDCWFRDLLSEKSDLTDDNLRMIVCDYLVGATFSITYPLYTWLNILVHNPNVQSAVQEEVDRVVGLNRCIMLADHERMPYSQACILELLRYQGMSPLIPHSTSKDTSVGGYSIPKDTMVILNLWAHSHDANLWPDPFLFNPQRFLTSSGELMPKEQHPRKDLFEFSAGPRSCPGEAIGKTWLLMLMTAIAQKFTVLPGGKLDDQATVHPEKDFHLGIVLAPRSYEIRLQDS